MYQSLVEGRAVPWDLLVKDVPKEHHHDLDYLIEMLDWEANVDPDFSAIAYFIPTGRAAPIEMTAPATRRVGRLFHAYYSAKELTVFPGASATLKDAAAYGVIVVKVWHIGKARSRNAEPDSVRRDDERRGVRQCGLGAQRGHDKES